MSDLEFVISFLRKQFSSKCNIILINTENTLEKSTRTPMKNRQKANIKFEKKMISLKEKSSITPTWEEMILPDLTTLILKCVDVAYFIMKPYMISLKEPRYSKFKSGSRNMLPTTEKKESKHSKKNSTNCI